MIYKVEATCPICNNVRYVKHAKNCSITKKCRPCFYKARKNSDFGSENIDKNGYVRIKIDNNTWVYKHRYIWELHHGKINHDFVVHHIDGNRLNNNIENLELMTRHNHNVLTVNSIHERINNGILPPIFRPHQKNFDKNYLISLIKEHKSLREVSKILETSKDTIIRTCQTYNIKYKFDRKTHTTIIIE